MTEEEKQRGLELQGYIDSIRDMTIKEVAIKYLKKHHLPKFLTRLLVKFSYPLLLAEDYELAELEEENKLLIQENEKMKKGLGCETCQIHLEYKDLNSKIAELKADNDARKFAMAMSEKVEKQLREENAKAKEIIRALLKHTYGQNLNTQNDFDLYLGRIKDAEQFLSEVEK